MRSREALKKGAFQNEYARFKLAWMKMTSLITFMLLPPKRSSNKLRGSEAAEPHEVRKDRCDPYIPGEVP